MGVKMTHDECPVDDCRRCLYYKPFTLTCDYLTARRNEIMNIDDYTNIKLDIEENCRKYRFWDDIDNCLACYGCEFFNSLSYEKCRFDDPYPNYN